MLDAAFAASPHRRYNPLTEEWVLVSPHRSQRPWQGQREASAGAGRPAHDPECYLCPGNPRAGGAVNPDYAGTFVFANDYAALMPTEGPGPREVNAGPFRAEAVRGECRVICFSPRHDLSMAQMTDPERRGVVDVWAAQTAELGARYRWVQVFENKGAVMGCSNPHPHGQVWAGDWLPTLVAKEDAAQADHLTRHGRTLLQDAMDAELADGSRIVEQNEDWVWWVPFWALWPFEVLLAPRRPVARLTDLTDRERDSLAAIMGRGLARYDGLFATSFPYSMGWHSAPFSEASTDHWHLHAHYYPPLLRSADVKKFMVGYEMMAEPQRDLTPELAAAQLRDVRI